jgi:hypothetical protein
MVVAIGEGDMGEGQGGCEGKGKGNKGGEGGESKRRQEGEGKGNQWQQRQSCGDWGCCHGGGGV